MSLREALQEIYDEHGRLTPAIVVEEARPKNSPLHSKFEWNDKVAGEAYRLDQARELIRRVKVTRVREDSTHARARAYLSIADDNGGRAYQSTEEVLADPLLAKLTLADFEREWRQFKARWQGLREFRELILQELEEAI